MAKYTVQDWRAFKREEEEAEGGDEAGRAFDRALPVPFRHRHDGWTKARQATFLARLTETGCVRAACEAAGLSSTSAYRARVRMPAFGQCWDQALAVRRPMLEDAAFERAVNGVTVPVTRRGEVVGERRRYSDGLLKYLIERADRREAAGMGIMAGGQPVATQEEMEVALLNRLVDMGKALERQRREDPEAAARLEAEDKRLLAEYAESHAARLVAEQRAVDGGEEDEEDGDEKVRDEEDGEGA